MKNITPKQFAKVCAIWFFIPFICSFLASEVISIMFFPFFDSSIREVSIGDGILCFFLILEMIKMTKKVLNRK